MAWRDPWENVDRSNALRMQSDAQGINMLQALGGAQTNALQRQQLQTQMADQARTRDKQLRLENALTSVGPDADMPKIIRAIAGVDPMKAQEMARQYSKDQREGFAKVDPKDYTPESVGMFTRTQNFSDLVPVRKKDTVNGQVVDLYAAPVGQVIPKQADAPDPTKDLLLRGPDGSMTPNQPLIDVKRGLASAGAAKTVVNMADGQKGFDNELKLRGDFRQEPVYKAHQEMTSAHQQITQALRQQSPAGDLAGATKIMKLLDPGSVVRESELGMAMAASGLMDRITNYAGMVMKGTKLTPTQRADFQKLGDALFNESVTQYNKKRAEYTGLAANYGLNPERVAGSEVKPPAAPASPAKPGRSVTVDY